MKEGREIVVNGRRGKLDKRWFKRANDAKKVKKHLKKKPNSRMKVKGRRMDGWEHYSRYGHNEGREHAAVVGVALMIAMCCCRPASSRFERIRRVRGCV